MEPSNNRLELGKNLQERTKKFSLRIIDVVENLPQRTIAGRRIGGQLFDCGTSVGANYRAACRARSAREFIAKLSIVFEEADETLFWLELIVERKLLPARRLAPLIQEATEIVRIVNKSLQTARGNQAKATKTERGPRSSMIR